MHHPDWTMEFLEMYSVFPRMRRLPVLACTVLACLSTNSLTHAQSIGDPIKWPAYTPTLEYDFRKETAKIDPPTKVLDDGVENVKGTVVSGWWCFRYGPNVNPKLTENAWKPMLERLNQDAEYIRNEFGWPPDKRAKKGYYSTVYLFGSGMSTDDANSEALGGWMGSVRHKGEDWPMVLLSYYPVWAYDPKFPKKEEAGYQTGAVVHEYVHAIQADMPGCKKAAWFHEGGNNWVLGMMEAKRTGKTPESMGWLSAGSMLAPFLPIECYSGWLQDGSFGGPAAEGVDQGKDSQGRTYATWRKLLGGVAYSEAFPYFMGEFVSEKSIAWIWQNCPGTVLEGIANAKGGLGDKQTRRLITEYRGRAAMCDFGKWSPAYEKLLVDNWGAEIVAEGDPIWKKCEPWKATCYAKTTNENGTLTPDPLTLPGWSGANQIPLKVSGKTGDLIGVQFDPKGENMSCQLVYRAKDGSVVYSRPVEQGACALRLVKPVKDDVVIAVICNTDYVFKGEKTRTAKYDYRLKLAKGIKDTADIHKQWFLGRRK
ncbi:MAG: hypothetical protein EOP88_05515 [Verrucomicrobiaceae bacterium]|nr:MAG: hypothetical protein EOP88_05515 [Verrucomicrobiaceae bacterium]